MLVFLTLVAFLHAAHTKECLPHSILDFTSQDGKLFANGRQFHLKGIAWFGFETVENVVDGLWAQPWTTLLDIVANNSFNALRLPFNLNLVLTDPQPGSIIDYNKNPDLKGLSSLQILDKIILGAQKRGILVMLDMHCLEGGANSQDGLWYDNQFSAKQNVQGWLRLVNRYKNMSNVFALDVFNEPFAATWGKGNGSTDFNLWAEHVGNAVHAAGVSWLINVEGVDTSPPCAQGCFWGENLQGAGSHPVQLNVPNKVVYSPHVYGPNVFNMPYFNAPNFPSNMPAIWTTHYGYLRKKNEAAVVMGEWGGYSTGANGVWMRAFVNYSVGMDMRDSFFWCLNPNSGDTGGLLLNDWKTVDTGKAALLKQMQPSPTKVVPAWENERVSGLCFH